MDLWKRITMDHLDLHWRKGNSSCLWMTAETELSAFSKIRLAANTTDLPTPLWYFVEAITSPRPSSVFHWRPDNSSSDAQTAVSTITSLYVVSTHLRALI